MIVVSVEGPDYSGKTTLIAEIKKKAEEDDYTVYVQAFPSHDGHGAKAREYIGGKKPDTKLATHHLIMNFKEKSEYYIGKDYGDEKVLIILDRYVVTTFAHQSTIVDITSGEFLVPNHVILLSLSHQTMLERKKERDGETVDWDSKETSKYLASNTWKELCEGYRIGSSHYSKYIDTIHNYDGSDDKVEMAAEFFESMK